MKNKLRVILAILLLVAGSLVFLPKQEMVVYADSNTIETKVLINGDDTYMSNTSVGTAWGYGRFVLNATNVTIGASANLGYSLVGWQITDSDTNVYLITINSLADANTTIEPQADGGLIITRIDGDITYTMTFTDMANDGYYESSSFTISKIADNLTVSPVYDHIYYSVDVTDFYNLVDFDDNTIWNTLTLGSQTVISKESVVDDLYKDAFLKENGKIYYVGDVYSNGTNFYTKHATLQDTPLEQLVDLSKGAFRLGSQVNVDFDIDFDKDNLTTDSINVLVNCVNLDGSAMDNAPNNGYIVTNHATYGNSVNVKVNLTIARDSTNNNVTTNTLTVDYDNLYVATLNVSVDDVNIDKSFDEYDLILNSITAHNTLNNSDLGNDAYFIVENESLRIVASPVVKKMVGGTNYSYYDFKAIDDVENAEKIYDPATSDIVVRIEYTSIEYLVDFKFVLKRGLDYVDGTDDYNLENSFSLKRGESQTITRTLVSNNVGYDFYGFAMNTHSVTQNSSIDVSIDYNKPRDLTILMIYTEIDYSLELAGFDSINLSNGSTIYPIEQAKLNFGGKEYIINGSTLRSAGTKTYSTVDGPDVNLKAITFSDAIINIKDNITLALTINKGFNINGFKFNINDITYVSNSQVVTFIVSKQVLSSLTDNVITLIVEESYAQYNFEYYIDESSDINFVHKIVMADIDIDISSMPYVTKEYEYIYEDYLHTEDDWNNNYDKYYVYQDGNYIPNTSDIYVGTLDYRIRKISRVKLSGLHLYDRVELRSTPYSILRGELDYTYLFIRYTENGMTGLTPVIYEDPSYVYVADISKNNTSIKVVYSIPNTQLRVNVSHVAAYDLTEMVVSKNGSPLESISDADDIYYIVDINDELIISLGDNGYNNAIAFGYALQEVTLDGVHINNEADNIYNYKIRISSSGVHFLSINLKVLDFHIVVKQDGAGKVDENVIFINDGVTAEYKLATIAGVEFEVEMPEGYYVYKVSYLEGTNYIEQASNLAQDNTYDGSTYYYSNSGTSYLTMLQSYAMIPEGEDYYVMTIKLEYRIHTYDIEIQFKIANIKNDRITTPKFIISYYYDGNLITANNKIKAGKNIAFFDEIPYGIAFEIKLNGIVRPGMKYVSWTDGYDSTLDSNLYSYSENGLKTNGSNVIIENLNFIYTWAYQSYTINVEIANGDNTMGNPKIAINALAYESGNSTASVSLYDIVNINAYENRSNGYVFKRYFYYTDKYIPYEYSLEDWERNYAQYYIYTADGYKLNSDPKYYEENDYYLYQENYEVEFVDSSIFIEEFDILNHKQNNIIVIYVEYKELLVTINPVSVLESGNLSTGDLYLDVENKTYITVNDIVTYTITAYNKRTQQVRTLGPSDTATHEDKITITKSYNTISLTSGAKDKDGNPIYITYDLSKGISLITITQFPQFIQSGEPEVEEIQFDLGNYISGVDNNVFNVTFKYAMKKVSVKSTTNIEDSNFYSDALNGIKFYTAFNNGDPYKFGTDEGSSQGDVSIINTAQYLTGTRLTYSRSPRDDYRLQYSGYANYFYVSSVNIYEGLTNNPLKIIPSSEWENRGIHIEYANAKFNNGKIIKVIDYIDVRMTTNLYVEYQVSAILYFNNDSYLNGNPLFERYYDYIVNAGNQIEGISQTLTVGVNNSDILAADIIVNNLQMVKYYIIENGVRGDEISEPFNVGRYQAVLAFKDDIADDTISWLNTVKLNYTIYLDILPKTVYITHSQPINKFEKPYDGGSTYNSQNVYSLLMITDSPYSGYAKFSMTISGSPFALSEGYSTNITETNGMEQKNAHNASLLPYNIYWTNLALNPSVVFNRNFILDKDTYLMESIILINRAELNLVGVELRDKVYDGDNIAYLSSNAEVKLSGLAVDNEVKLDISKLSIKYENGNVGADKNVTISAEEALSGNVNNYFIENLKLKASIYPYMIKTELEGVGEIILENRDGLTDPSKVKEIPINAVFKISAIYRDTPEYAEIFDNISQYITTEKVFAIGYRLNFVVDGITSDISKNLYLVVPNVKKLLSVIWNTGNIVGELEYSIENDKIAINLSQISAKVSTVILTQQRVLLELWQIILIVVLILLLIITIIIVVLVIKNKREAKYKIHDKI